MTMTMNANDILHILHTTTGDVRGVDGDDLLLARLHNELDKVTFWAAFGDALSRLLRLTADGDQALAQAASFLAHVPPADRPANATPLIDDLLEALEPEQTNTWPRHASVLRLLTHLGAGDHTFWREQLRFWEGAVASADHGFLAAALDALVQAIRGVVAKEGLGQKDFSRLFSAMSEVADFPAIELYTALVEETRKERRQADFSPESLRQGVLKAWADFRAAPCVSSVAPSEQQLDLLNQVVIAWIKDEQLGDSPDISRSKGRAPPWPVPCQQLPRKAGTVAMEQRA